MVMLRLSIVLAVPLLALTLLAWLAPTTTPEPDRSAAAPLGDLARHQGGGCAAGPHAFRSCVPTGL